MTISKDALIDDVLQHLEGFGMVQGPVAWLGADVSATDLEWPLSTDRAVPEGLAEVGNELVYLRRFDSAAGLATIAPDGRGYRSTTAVAHSQNDRVRLNPAFPRTAVGNAIDSAIAQAYPTVWGVKSTEIRFNASHSTYGLPKDCRGILQVSTDTYGPTREWPRVRHYRFDPGADTDMFPTGNTITLECGLWPGKNFRVVYYTQPTALGDGQTLTDIGLSDSMRTALIAGASSHLCQFMDPVRLATQSAQTRQASDFVNVGDPSKIAAQLYQRFLLELDNERRRLRVDYPPEVRKFR